GNPPEQRATVSPYSNKPGAVQRVAVPSGPDLDYAGSCARKPPSLAVALNCGTGSSFLNALVNAFDKLHMVLAENSGYCGSKYNRGSSGSRLLGASSLPSMNAV